MKTLTKHLGGASLLLASVLGLAGCYSSSQEGKAVAAATPAPPTTTIGVTIDDSVLTSKVKSALLGDELVKSMDIKVETYKGEVMLSGYVNNAAQIERSLSVAQAVTGVQSVNNKLSVKEGSESVGNKIDDSVITTRVKSAIMGDASLKSGEVAVITRKGEVQLSGFVDSELQMAHAAAVAKGVDGVLGVENHLAIKK
ncbi:MAG: BON domain-containing protein [Burkholderiales bacterium]|nr:BON domain-containing protein [Burkholderiales bacterium]